MRGKEGQGLSMGAALPSNAELLGNHPGKRRRPVVIVVRGDALAYALALGQSLGKGGSLVSQTRTRQAYRQGAQTQGAQEGTQQGTQEGAQLGDAGQGSAGDAGRGTDSGTFAPMNAARASLQTLCSANAASSCSDVSPPRRRGNSASSTFSAS
jgi:hypothetical protein